MALLEIIVLLWQRTYQQNLMMSTKIKLTTTALYKDSSLRFTIKSKINFLVNNNIIIKLFIFLLFCTCAIS